MTHVLYPLRFFRVVRAQPPLIVWTFACLVAVGSAAIVQQSTRGAGALLPVLLLQVFAASSGFEVPARRGHYDLLLTSGHRRTSMAVVHWASSIAPGAVSWLILAGVEAGVSRGAGTQLLTTGTIAAMVLVSTLPWAITVRLPRYSGAIGWLLALAISTSVWPAIHDWSAWSFLVYPAGVVGRELSLRDSTVAAPAMILAAAAMAIAFRWIARASVPLEAAQ
jgi:hypothetical protein